MNILGISAFYHDSAACVVHDGQIVAAVQEERFPCKEHDYQFPRHALDYYLREADLVADELDYVAFYDKFERLLRFPFYREKAQPVHVVPAFSDSRD